MTLSKQTMEILLDLIEIKVSSLQVQDREDARELAKLRKCRQELLTTNPLTNLKTMDDGLKAGSPERNRIRKTYYSR